MIQWRSATLVLLGLVALTPLAAAGQVECTPEVQAAKDMLKAKTAAASQAPRSLAGAREEIQAPRGQDVQAPRGQDVQAPRGQDVQAPRGQEPQAGGGAASPTSESSTVSRARELIRSAEAACGQGDQARAAAEANAAMELLKTLP